MSSDLEPDIEGIHASVLRQRCVDLLAPSLAHPGATYVDATTGMGGHTRAVLEACPQARAICIDRDEQALAIAGRRLTAFADRVTFVHSSYDHLHEILDEVEIDAILFDLGVSSLQLDDADRGFSYMHDAPLDMRMDQSQGITAADVVNTYEEGRLWTLLRTFGEEKHARRIAHRIVEMRAERPLRTTGDLVEAVRTATNSREQRGHPAKRVFQAIRIEVNQELAGLEQALPAALSHLRVGGTLVVMSFQSLEDRVVKRVFRDATSSRTPHGLPVDLPELRPEFELLTRGAEQADEAEQQQNSRSASVRLRAVRRTRRAA
ncbi:16S rRNA (cytosine(1402)-N(4))-methyltransferase RsmH [Pseudoclavibacter soli]|uniref:16S rRNA (cytosine(1402)-N(4))-methyltransferase RsmH n=1 Tax=Pseudoclavibacter soli TaxID=452623 RepID=UPI0003F59887|nr:16S rRNA (cytosine(1402)-N(4))-methyltransferase RsmH [Pseudoclavibacter soli]